MSYPDGTIVASKTNSDYFGGLTYTPLYIRDAASDAERPWKAHDVTTKLTLEKFGLSEQRFTDKNMEHDLNNQRLRLVYLP